MIDNENELDELEDDVDDDSDDLTETDGAGSSPEAPKPTLDFSRAKRVEVLKAADVSGLSSFSDVIEGIENFDPQARPQSDERPLDKVVAAIISKATSIRNGDDLTCWFFEPLLVGDPGWPASDEEFKKAKIRARDILLPTVGHSRPRHFLQANWYVHHTSYGEKVFREFYALVEKILAAPTEYKESETPLTSRSDYGVPVSLTRDQIVPRPDLSRPPEPEPGQVYARATCRVCIAGGFALAHDCLMFQDIAGATP